MLEEPEVVVGLWTVWHADSMAASCSPLPKSPSILFPRKSRFFLKTKVDIEVFGFLSSYGPSIFTLSPGMVPHDQLVV